MKRNGRDLRTPNCRWLRLVLSSCAMLAPNTIAPVLAEDAEAYFIPAPDIRAAAERILKESAFQGFEHFGDPSPAGPTTAPEQNRSVGATPETADAPAVDETPSGTPQTWWERIRSRRESTSSPPGGRAGDASGETTSETTEKPGSQPGARVDPGVGTEPARGPANDTAPQSPGARQSSSTSTERVEADSGAADGARPQRTEGTTSPRGIPSLRGRDGVERPVRFAPKQETPRTPDASGSDWSFDPGFGSFFGAIGNILGSLLHLVAYAALGVICVLIVILAARALQEVFQMQRRKSLPGMARAVPLADDRSPGEVAADVYLQRSLELAGQQRYREALGQLVLGAMSAMEREQWIRYRRGLTLHDYLRSLRSRPVPLAGFQAVVSAYEPVEYGRRMATKSLFATALEGYQRGFSAGGAGAASA